jgi:hypothetical protein
MERPQWSVPAGEPSQGQAGQSSDVSGRTRARDYVGRLIFNLIFFGVIGILFSSWFPTALGLFLFFTDDEFIEWLLRTIGIRLVPDTPGPEFIKAFVFLYGLWTLLAYWKESAPAWLLPWIPAEASWYLIGGAALFWAAIKIIPVAVVRKLLPQVGVEIAPHRQGWAILVVLGMLIGLVMLALLIFDILSTPVRYSWATR